MPKTSSYKEGSLQRIATLLIKPILSHMPSDGDVTQWLTIMLGLNEREVVRYRSRSAFRMPGVLLEQPNVRRAAGQAIPRGAILWVRTDVRDRDIFHVEVTGNGTKNHVFELGASEWAVLKPKLYRLRKHEK